MTMSHLVRIGNSKGIIIPSKVRKQCHIDNDLLIDVVDGKIIISAPTVNLPRQGWDEAFKNAGTDPEAAFMDGVPNEFDDKEWTW